MNKTIIIAAALLAAGTFAVQAADMPPKPAAAPATGAIEPADPIERAFKSPEAGCYPEVYWRWIEGNISRVGITHDLEEMKKGRIGGVLLNVVGSPGPAGPVTDLSDEFYELVRFAIAECSRLGLTFSFINSSGWNLTGGPWITPDMAMQEIVWSETKVQGGETISLPLAQPKLKKPSVYALGKGSYKDPKLGEYKDIAVIAFPTPSRVHPQKPDILAGKIAQVRMEQLVPDIDMSVPADAVVFKNDIHDLSSDFVDGTLTWNNPPPGPWTIVRFGHAPLGVGLHAIAHGADGLIVDFMNPDSIDLQNRNYTKRMVECAGKHAKVLKYLEIDSWESGAQNWTPRFPAMFRSYVGYDIHKWLPALTGRIIGSGAETERFLWDFRKTICRLHSEVYWKGMTEAAHANNMELLGQPYGAGMFEDMTAGSKIDVPMTEIWSFTGGGGGDGVSCANISGKNICSAEMFPTDGPNSWERYPANMKRVADSSFTAGLNSMFYSIFYHSPRPDIKPGLTQGVGMQYNWTNTWWDYADELNTYFARCHYLLRQGHAVVDFLNFTGETLPTIWKVNGGWPGIGFRSNVCDDSVLLDKATVRDGYITFPSGMKYRFLVMPKPNVFMTPELLAKLRSLVWEGACLIGDKPQLSPSLKNYPACDQKVKELADEIWGQGPVNVFGKGTVYHGYDLQAVIAREKVSKDCEVDVNEPDWTKASNGFLKNLNWLHRQWGDRDIYFICNTQTNFVGATAHFYRIAEGVPEIWDTVTGTRSEASVYDNQNGYVKVPLCMKPLESCFVVFRRSNTPSSKKHITSAQFNGTPLNQAFETEVSAGVIAADHRKKALEYIPHYIDRQPVGVIATDHSGKVWLHAKKPGRYTFTVSDGTSLDISADTQLKVEVPGPWTVTFPPNLGAPERAVFDSLMPLKQHPDEGIKYFSGTATYTTSFELSSILPAHGYVLSLGEVRDMAEVIVNKTNVGFIMTPPFEVDVTSALQAGRNTVSILVTSGWRNRLIGDEQYPDEAEYRSVAYFWPNMRALVKWPDWWVNNSPRPPSRRVAFDSWKCYIKEDPLADTGLIGPVKLYSYRKYPLPLH